MNAKKIKLMDKLFLLWFRRDLRLNNNHALEYILSTSKNGHIIPIFILDTSISKQQPSFKRRRSLGGAQKVWLHHSLVALNKSLDGKLLIRSGDPSDVLLEVISEAKKYNSYSSVEVCCNKIYTPYADMKEEEIKQTLSKVADTELRTFEGYLLFRHEEVKNKQGQFYKVFSAFYKQASRSQKPKRPVKTENIDFARFLSPEILTSKDVAELNLLPRSPVPDWSLKLFQDIGTKWEPGEIGALKKLNEFLTHGLKKYSTRRDYPSELPPATSLLSPHLHWGEISPHQAWYSAIDSNCDNKQVEKYLAELGWREFSYYLLKHFPDLPSKNFNSKFDNFQWEQDAAQVEEKLKVWRKGNTGYPIVDAGMRQLWETGYMHNRVRMIVASFLTKDLFIDWKRGEEWFWDTLFDADEANNAAGWQWVAGSGADAAPYFRIFNPILQSKKFDPSGNYLRRWVPEISALDNKSIHAPWECPPKLLRDAEIILGTTYPEPIVDHSEARKIALNLYSSINTTIT